MRNEPEEQKKAENNVKQEERPVYVQEVIVDLSLLNQKLNHIIALLQKK